MEDLAMQILELLINSINHAKAKSIHLKIKEDVKENQIEIVVEDDGVGMDEKLINSFDNPFTSTRKTRKIGMGVPFFKGMIEQCNGSFSAQSEPGKGTIIQATMQRDHIDVPPMWDLGEMMMFCIQADETIDYDLLYQIDEKEFHFSSKEVKEQLDGFSLLEPQILLWVKDYINEGIEHIKEDM